MNTHEKMINHAKTYWEVIGYPISKNAEFELGENCVGVKEPLSKGKVLTRMILNMSHEIILFWCGQNISDNRIVARTLKSELPEWSEK